MPPVCGPWKFSLSVPARCVIWRSVAARLRVWLWQGPGFEVAHTLGQTLPREKIPALQLSLDPSGRFRQDKVTLYSKVVAFDESARVLRASLCGTATWQGRVCPVSTFATDQVRS